MSLQSTDAALPVACATVPRGRGGATCINHPGGWFRTSSIGSTVDLA
jgi:hypothetical protein